jgi:hypothetical protein
VTRYAAQLRVYEPLAALPANERDYWTEYVAAGRWAGRREGLARQDVIALAAAATTPPRVAPAGCDGEAFVLTRDGAAYLCPWRFRLRCLEAAAELRRSLPPTLADAFLPAPVAEAAGTELGAWRTRHPEARVGILTSTWQVPPPWFVLFEPAERELALRDAEPRTGQAPPDTGRRSLYRTEMARARQRVARALRVVRRGLDDQPTLAALEDVGRWLEDFHPHAIVELDYAGLVDLVGDDDLAGDDSVALVAEALRSLARNEPGPAVRAYGRLLERWRPLAALENAN